VYLSSNSLYSLEETQEVKVKTTRVKIKSFLIIVC